MLQEVIDDEAEAPKPLWIACFGDNCSQGVGRPGVLRHALLLKMTDLSVSQERRLTKVFVAASKLPIDARGWSLRLAAS